MAKPKSPKDADMDSEMRKAAIRESRHVSYHLVESIEAMKKDDGHPVLAAVVVGLLATRFIVLIGEQLGPEAQKDAFTMLRGGLQEITDTLAQLEASCARTKPPYDSKVN
jgi:hypothetical protein